MLLLISTLLFASWIADVRRFTVDIEELRTNPPLDSASEFFAFMGIVACLVWSVWKVAAAIVLTVMWKSTLGM